MEGVWAVVLAAGASRRFGSNKLLAPLWGRPLLLQTLEAVTAARRSGVLAGVVVVVAAGDTATARTVAPSGAFIADNPDPELGMGRSLQLGLRRLDHPSVDPPAGAAVIVLGDQPLVRAEVVALLVDAWHGGSRIVRPVYREEASVPGHPVLLDRSQWHLVSAAMGDRGLGPVLALHPDWVTAVMVDGHNPDIDIPEDLTSLEDAN